LRCHALLPLCASASARLSIPLLRSTRHFPFHLHQADSAAAVVVAEVALLEDAADSVDA